MFLPRSSLSLSSLIIDNEPSDGINYCELLLWVVYLFFEGFDFFSPLIVTLLSLLLFLEVARNFSDASNVLLWKIRLTFSSSVWVLDNSRSARISSSSLSSSSSSPSLPPSSATKIASALWLLRCYCCCWWGCGEFVREEGVPILSSNVVSWSSSGKIAAMLRDSRNLLTSVLKLDKIAN